MDMWQREEMWPITIDNVNDVNCSQKVAVALYATIKAFSIKETISAYKKRQQTKFWFSMIYELIYSSGLENKNGTVIKSFR